LNEIEFNKYLSGQIKPNRHNERRIGEFFKIDVAMLDLPHREFSANFKNPSARQSGSGGSIAFFEQMVKVLPNEIEKLRRYVGYYYLWFYSTGFEGYIVKSLMSVYEKNGVICTKAIEHLTASGDEFSDACWFKYAGTMFYLSDRIFVFEYETLTKNSLNLTILNASYRSKISSLRGIAMGVASRPSREPSACRVEWEYLGNDINVRAALKSCRLYKHDCDDIDPALKTRISNEIRTGEYLLQSLMT